MMRRKEKTRLEGGKVAFEAIVGRQGGEGPFGLEDKAGEIGRQAKLRSLAEQIALYDRGYVRWAAPLSSLWPGAVLQRGGQPRAKYSKLTG
jgi:hypothetical protein